MASKQQNGTWHEDNEEVDRTQDFSKDENEERGNWSGRLDFLLSCLGYAVGLGNVWRFPYLCYKNGGAAFFIPYVIMLFFVGIPIFFLELSLGQFTSMGSFTTWEFANIFKGIGVGMFIVSGIVGIYYNMIIGWALYYLFATLISIPTGKLPWQICDPAWSTMLCDKGLDQDAAKNCTTLGHTAYENGTCWNQTSSTLIGFWNESVAKNNSIEQVLSSQEYLNRYVLGKDLVNGIDELGPLRWDLVLAYLGAFIIVALSLIKGIKSSGKVVYFTAIFPYVMLVVLLIRGVTLPHYQEGIEFYITNVNFTKLQEAEVWKDAAVQIFFSLSASWGGLITLASYNRFHNDCLRDTLIVALGNCLTSFFAGFVIFSFLGFLAFKTNKLVQDVAEDGVGLAFIIYPEAVTYMPVPHLWACLFFLMLITLGLDSEFALVETVTTSILDQFPKLRKRKPFVTIGTCIVLFLLGLTLCTNGGAYLLQLMDNYAGGWNVLLIALMECVSIAYVYGFSRYKRDIGLMLGRTGCFCFPWECCSYWWGACWYFFTPIGVIFILIFSWVDYKPLKYGDYLYPVWAEALGWLMTMAVVAGIFLTAIVLFIMESGSFMERMKKLSSPSIKWGPALPKHRRLINYVPGFVVDPEGKENIAFSDMKGASNLGYVPHVP